MSEWIKHEGSECPVTPHTWVTVRNSVDDEETTGTAGSFLWTENIDEEGRIHEYKIIDTTVTVGDLNSNTPGSGARMNGGKAPLDLIPANIMGTAQAFIRQSNAAPGPVDWTLVLGSISRWQMERGSPAELYWALALVNTEPGMWDECARVFDYGRGKYAAWNWAKGMPWSVPLGCILRHIVGGILAGEHLDPESGEPHRGHVVCNIVMLIWYMKHYREGDDRRLMPGSLR